MSIRYTLIVWSLDCTFNSQNELLLTTCNCLLFYPLYVRRLYTWQVAKISYKAFHFVAVGSHLSSEERQIVNWCWYTQKSYPPPNILIDHRGRFRRSPFSLKLIIILFLFVISYIPCLLLFSLCKKFLNWENWPVGKCDVCLAACHTSLNSKTVGQILMKFYISGSYKRLYGHLDIYKGRCNRSILSHRIKCERAGVS